MKNILITGITGSGGSYLADYILNNHPDYNITGVCRWHSTAKHDNIKLIIDHGSPTRCQQLGLINAKGRYITWAHDIEYL